MRALFLLVLGWLVVTPTLASAAPPRNLQKTRPGSMLRREKAWDEAPDLRGEHERRRDKELVTHYRRMAELDVLQAVAQEVRDLGLQESIEEVRRKEVQRHYRALMRLRQQSEAALAAGGR